MSDYGDPIILIDYKYRRQVYFKSPYSIFSTNIIAKLVLSTDNFNFELSNSDGSDFRLLDSNGNTLKMWKATWSKEMKHAVLFFKIPSLLGNSSVSFSAYWGNSKASDVSDPDSLNFMFYDGFTSSPLSSSKWSGKINSGISDYGYLISSEESFITKTNPLVGKSSWVLEAGLFCNFGYEGWSDYSAVGFGFEGSENDLIIKIFLSSKIRHNARDYTFYSSSKQYGGLEPYSYNDVVITYYEPDDRIDVRILNRLTFNDVSHTMWRRVEGNTVVSNARIYGRERSGQSYGPYPTYINWLVIRDYDSVNINNLDGRDLFIEHEYVVPQRNDFLDYSENFLDATMIHESSLGGDPYSVSNGVSGSQSSCWISDNGASSVSSVDITFFTCNFGHHDTFLLSHYDSGHEYYYGAAKLSNNNEDRMNRNQWKCTSNSGWASVKFNSPTNVSAFSISTGMSISGRPKDFIFYGSNSKPKSPIVDAVNLTEGTFSNTSGYQLVSFINGEGYMFYILEVLNTYSGNIIIDEWKMLKSFPNCRKKYPTQLRLLPASFGTFQYNFPKEISVTASNDGASWDTLIPWTKTYTPFYNHSYGEGLWQKYSFINTKGYILFKLQCRGNWLADTDRIIIDEVSLHEFDCEDYTFRILDITDNNISQIWADFGCVVDDTYSIFYLTGSDKLFKIASNRSSGSVDLPTGYEDFNIVFY